MFLDFKKNSRAYKLITVFVMVSLILAAIFSIWEKNWLNLFTTVITITLFLIVQLFQDKYNFKLHSELQITVLLFIYASVFLGGVADFYNRFSWFDSLLHTVSGLGLGFLGFIILYSLYKTGKMKTSPFLVSFFAFCFALSLGVLWEIFEFLMDEMFDSDMQKARNLEYVYGYFETRLGLLDTMKDLMLDALGALTASTIGYLYLKGGDFKIFKKLISNVEESNPHYFEK
jgi:uncharacterized membrane protein YjdF